MSGAELVLGAVVTITIGFLLWQYASGSMRED
jgi:hypothetical protein